jgi:transcriptional regulator with XRE-family HTH domain
MFSYLTSSRFANFFMDPKTVEFKRLVVAAGWSQAEAARRLNITPGAVSQIFSGNTRPRQALLSLLRILARPPAKKKKTPEDQPAEPRTPWEIELLACIRNLSDSQRQLVLRLARELSA